MRNFGVLAILLFLLVVACEKSDWSHNPNDDLAKGEATIVNWSQQSDSLWRNIDVIFQVKNTGTYDISEYFVFFDISFANLSTPFTYQVNRDSLDLKPNQTISDTVAFAPPSTISVPDNRRATNVIISRTTIVKKLN